MGGNNMIWWEKTVEYKFFLHMLERGLISIFPLDGNPEEAGDAILNFEGNFLLIEFKRTKKDIDSENKKFKGEDVYFENGELLPQLGNKGESFFSKHSEEAKAHFFIYGEFCHDRAIICAQNYWYPKIELDTPITIGEWHRQKAIQSHAEDLSGSLELAFSTFFLNRTNRSGIIKGGVIGGKNQSGEWKLSARFSKSNLINRIQRIANRRDQITLSRMDAVEFLKVFQHKKDSEPYFFYLDPPYYEKGAGLYDNFYQPEDHSILANYIQKLEYPWIISYDNVPEVRKLYSDYRAITYSLNYTAQTKEVGHEFMAFSNGLTLPNDIRQKKSSFGCMRDVIAVNWN